MLASIRALGTWLVPVFLIVGLGQPALAGDEARVVSVGGSVTEIVYALGAGDRLVGVDSTSLYPDAAQEVPDVGYMRRLSAEPILSLEPDIVLAAADAGPPEALAQLRAAGVEVVEVPDTPSPAGVTEKVQAVAAALGLAGQGDALAKRLARQFDRLQARLADVDTRPRVLLLLAVGRGTPMAAGTDTAAQGMIELAHGRNAIEAFSNYKPLSREAVVAAAPDVFLTTQRTIARFGGRQALLERPELASTQAGREGRLIVMDGLLLLGFGPRTPQAAAQLAAQLHGSLEAPDLSPDLSEASVHDSGD
jgi:iron complex transport system substrate-binding protein